MIYICPSLPGYHSIHARKATVRLYGTVWREVLIALLCSTVVWSWCSGSLRRCTGNAIQLAVLPFRARIKEKKRYTKSLKQNTQIYKLPTETITDQFLINNPQKVYFLFFFSDCFKGNRSVKTLEYMLWRRTEGSPHEGHHWCMGSPRPLSTVHDMLHLAALIRPISGRSLLSWLKYKFFWLTRLLATGFLIASSVLSVKRQIELHWQNERVTVPREGGLDSIM